MKMLRGSLFLSTWGIAGLFAVGQVACRSSLSLPQDGVDAAGGRTMAGALGGGGSGGFGGVGPGGLGGAAQQGDAAGLAADVLAPVAPVDASVTRPDFRPDVSPSLSSDRALDLAPVEPSRTYGVGKGCVDDTGCMPGFTCLDEGEKWPAAGYCTKVCERDEDCGGDGLCAAPIGDDMVRLCFARCAAGRTCASAASTCSQKVSGIIDLGVEACVPGRTGARDGDACMNFGDCRGPQACLRNPFSAPDGMCVTIGCKPGDSATCAPGGDGVCLPYGNSGLCLDSCKAPADCRIAKGYTCLDDPSDNVPGLCAFASRGPGKDCRNDRECGPAPWECLTGTTFPGGYCGGRGCTVGDENTCPFDTQCHDPDPTRVNDQYCIRTCTKDSDCRVAEGYKCSTLVDGKGKKGCKL